MAEGSCPGLGVSSQIPVPKARQCLFPCIFYRRWHQPFFSRDTRSAPLLDAGHNRLSSVTSSSPMVAFVFKAHIMQSVSQWKRWAWSLFPSCSALHTQPGQSCLILWARAPQTLKATPFHKALPLPSLKPCGRMERLKCFLGAWGLSRSDLGTSQALASTYP